MGETAQNRRIGLQVAVPVMGIVPRARQIAQWRLQKQQRGLASSAIVKGYLEIAVIRDKHYGARFLAAGRSRLSR